MSGSFKDTPEWGFDPTLERQTYVRRLLEGYCHTPTTVGKVRREDRRLAGRLYDQQVPLAVVQAAFSLAASRRLFRSSKAPELTPVRSLHYFLPVIEEIRTQPIDPGYISALELKLRHADYFLTLYTE